MKHSAFCYVARRALIGGRNSNRQSSAVVRSFAAAEIGQKHLYAYGGNGGLFYWKRMMSSQAAPSKPSAEETEAKSTEKNEKKKEESSGTKNNVVASSYWGISRPKIMREDGTEWPWNCFMVTIF